MHRGQVAGIPILHFKYNDKLENTKGQAVIIYFHGGGWEWFDAGKQFAVCIIHVRPITNRRKTSDFLVGTERVLASAP